MSDSIQADIIIFGGGIAGLWLLHRLRQQGYSAILFESNALGSGQTIKAQGIIHGGMKYALSGKVTNEVTGMSDLPDYWRHCLAGKGEVNLSNVPIRSKNHYLWSPSKIMSKFAGVLANATLSSEVEKLSKADLPSAFQDPAFRGNVYALDEVVIDVPALIRELVKANQDAVYHIEPVSEDGLHLTEDGKLDSVSVSLAGKTLKLNAQRFIFTAGSGNEVIVNKLNLDALQMQRRPLHMVLAKTYLPHSLFAHCVGFGPRPRMTITTHQCQDGSNVWYLGGQIAEDGIHLDKKAQIQAAAKELQALFPWLDFSNTEYATFMVDRAEPSQKSGLKPETAFSKTIQNVTVAWPTKLALAPSLAEDVCQHIQMADIKPGVFNAQALRAWPMPPLAQPVWEREFCKNVI